jgi:hypothetical protein
MRSFNGLETLPHPAYKADYYVNFWQCLCTEAEIDPTNVLEISLSSRNQSTIGYNYSAVHKRFWHTLEFNPYTDVVPWEAGDKTCYRVLVMANEIGHVVCASPNHCD